MDVSKRNASDPAEANFQPLKHAYAQTPAEFAPISGETFWEQSCRPPTIKKKLRPPDVGSPSSLPRGGPVDIVTGADFATHLLDNPLITPSNWSDEDMIGYEAGAESVL